MINSKLKACIKYLFNSKNIILVLSILNSCYPFSIHLFKIVFFQILFYILLWFFIQIKTFKISLKHLAHWQQLNCIIIHPTDSFIHSFIQTNSFKLKPLNLFYFWNSSFYIQTFISFFELNSTFQFNCFYVFVVVVFHFYVYFNFVLYFSLIIDMMMAIQLF